MTYETKLKLHGVAQLCILIAVFAAIAAIFALGVKREHTPNPIPTPMQAETQAESVQLLPQLIPICACESGLRHYEDDGITVRRGRKNPLDIGICQVNLFYHGARAESMGLDLFNESDNILFANLLYQEQGAKPWDWSKKCWDNGNISQKNPNSDL